ncbi:LOW QUALITY PROTEIN: uncharacterized protein LOC112086860 [Eutrema salsugineum]|uniref:LOW QUALITY PROTEIN: uncharacterized protein LOC112086860 n=1 Tax=Eutrema salsugineum TaxID=72664 RepID=UPI000CED57B4|nr:LOW QUALITY PROTEIN: uncharacterized protein LOC112086860 [Eutrema salsugineum]
MTSFVVPDYVTTKERNRTCFLETVTTTERIKLKTFPVKSLCSSLSVTYQKDRNFATEISLDTYYLYHHFDNPSLRFMCSTAKSPNSFLSAKKSSVITSQWSCRRRVSQVLFRNVLWLIYISRLEATKNRSYRRGFMIEVEIKVESG